MLAEHELYYHDKAVDSLAYGNYRALTRAIASPINKLCFTGFNHSTAGEVRQYLVQGLTMAEIAWKFAIPVEELEYHMSKYPIDYQKKMRISYEEAQEMAKCKRAGELTYRQIADKFGYKCTTVRSYLKVYNLWEPEVLTKRNELTLAEAKRAIQEHRAGATYRQLAAKYDCGQNTFIRMLKDYGVYEGKSKNKEVR